MPKITICVGVPASGKTTWAEQQTDCVNLNRDDIRQTLFGPFKWGEYDFTRENEDRVTQVQKQLFFDATIEGKDVIISDTNLNPKVRSSWESIATIAGYDVEYKVFHITLEEALKRDAAREMSVGPNILRDMYRKYQDQSQDLIVQYFKELLNTKWEANGGTSDRLFVFDIDGTLSSNGGHRGWFDWHKVGEDSVRKPVQLIAQQLNLTNEYTVIMSGRDECCRQETADWLSDKAEVVYDDLYMRPKNDHRKDWLVKLELLENLSNRPAVVFDDRDQVVEVFREIGLDVFQVADGNF